ncbi:MAG: FMN-binding negative transcriptional regulator [Dehalococcoidia bacterium]|jgi:transcriptional regulator|nr:FMN-binding negative transcriptional regulator [Dehalococcoidia bacterium]
MYIPRHFQLEDHEAIAAVLRDHSFGTLVTTFDGEPQATHLPFVFDPDRGQYGTLVSHMARANPQWQQFARYGPEGGLALAIFQGPHSYISPTWYGDTEPAVPTWNYIAVHAYGRPLILDDPSAVRALLDQLVDTNEAGLDPQWSLSSQSDEYVERMMRAIVAFEIPLERLEAKAKLSQNKSDEMRLGAADALEAQGWPDSAEIARLMRTPPASS